MKYFAVSLALAFACVPFARAQTFTFVDAYFDGDVQGPATIDGLSDAFATAVSPEGAHVYVCSGNALITSSDNALAVFSRGADGRLTFVEAEFDDEDGGTADGLASCRDVVVSPDGAHVYTAGFSDDKIGIFNRDLVTGELTFDSVVTDGVGLDGLAGVTALAVTADGLSLFAVGSTDDALVAFARNPATGALTFQDVEQEGVAGVVGLDRPLDVAISPDGTHIYTAAGGSENFSGSNALAFFTWDAGGGNLGFVEAYVEAASQGPNTIDGLHWVSSVVVSPDGAHVYATAGVELAGDQDWIAVFSRSQATGALTWIEAIDHFVFCDIDVLFQFETYAAIHPGGERVFITSGAEAVAEFARDPVTGGLTFADAICLFDDNLSIGINLPRRLALDPTGRHVYVPGQADDAVAVFDADYIVFTDGFESGDTTAWSLTTRRSGLP